MQASCKCHAACCWRKGGEAPCVVTTVQAPNRSPLACQAGSGLVSHPRPAYPITRGPDVGEQTQAAEPEVAAASVGVEEPNIAGLEDLALGNKDRLAFRDAPPGGSSRAPREIGPTQRPKSQTKIDAEEVKRRVAKALQKKGRGRVNTKGNKNKQGRRERKQEAKAGGW